MSFCYKRVLLQCASDYSKKYFIQWVKSAIIILSHNGSEVEGGGFRVWHFSPHCNLCDLRSKWEELGLERAILNVKWDTVRTRKYVVSLRNARNVHDGAGGTGEAARLGTISPPPLRHSNDTRAYMTQPRVLAAL